jgi:hypothetical protein
MEAPPRTCRLVVLLLLLLLVAPWQGGVAARALNFTREDFPRDFVFGAGTSSYQVHHIYVYTVCSLPVKNNTYCTRWSFGRCFSIHSFLQSWVSVTQFDPYAVRRRDRCGWKESKHLGHFHSCRYSSNILYYYIWYGTWEFNHTTRPYDNWCRSRHVFFYWPHAVESLCILIIPFQKRGW